MQATDKLEVAPGSFDLTSGRNLPVWFRAVPSLGEFPTLSEPISADVVVVGGGLAGLTTAYLLSKNGKSVVLLEAREVGSGETGRTSAHLMSAVDDRYCELEKKHGKDVARIVAESQCGAVSLIESIVKDEKIDCDFERLNGFLFPGDNQNDDIIQREFTSARDAGMKVEMTQVPFPQGVPKKSGLKFGDQGQFHILKYMKGLIDACVKRGVKIFTNSSSSLPPTEEEHSAYVISNGQKVTGKHVVVAINYYWVITKQEAYRTYMVAHKVPKGSVQKALYWNTEDPYVYSRLMAGDDDSHEILLTGGEDHRVGTHTNYDERYNNLIKWTKEKFPVAQELVSKWSGQVTEPVDDLAFLGRAPSTKFTFMITGDSGTGMTNTTIGAMIINDLILEKDNRWTTTYDPARLMTADIMEYVKNGMETAASYKDWATPGEIKDIEDLKPGCGGIMRTGLATKVACYRDKDGKLSACSAVCTHLQAIVMWNDTEKSFDCPAHGSRFDPYGKPIMGPACNALPMVDVATLKSQ